MAEVVLAQCHRAYEEHLAAEGLTPRTRDMVWHVIKKLGEKVCPDADALLRAHRASLDEYIAVSRGEIEPGCAWY